jgi:hypothetical protein
MVDVCLYVDILFINISFRSPSRLPFPLLLDSDKFFEMKTFEIFRFWVDGEGERKRGKTSVKSQAGIRGRAALKSQRMKNKFKSVSNANKATATNNVRLHSPLFSHKFSRN